MAQLTKENGLMAWLSDTGSSLTSMVTLILGSGKTIKQMVWAYSSKLRKMRVQVAVTKESLNWRAYSRMINKMASAGLLLINQFMWETSPKD